MGICIESVQSQAVSSFAKQGKKHSVNTVVEVRCVTQKKIRTLRRAQANVPATLGRRLFCWNSQDCEKNNTKLRPGFAPQFDIPLTAVWVPLACEQTPGKEKQSSHTWVKKIA